MSRGSARVASPRSRAARAGARRLKTFLSEAARNSSSWLPLLFFLGIVAFQFQEFVFKGQAYLGDSDRLFGTIPVLNLMAREIAANRLPLWNDLNLSGYSIAQSGFHPFYLPNLLLLKFFPTRAVLGDTLRLVLETVGMFFAAYWLFLKVWQDRLLAMFSSVAYGLSLSSVMMFSFPFAAPYGVVLMLGFLWDWQRRSMGLNVLGLTAALALEVTGTFPQVFAYIILFVFVVSVARTATSSSDHRPAVRLLALWVISGALALMIAAPAVVPFLQGLRTSTRTPLGYPTIVSNFQQPWFSVFRLGIPYFMGEWWQFPRLSGYNTNDFEFFPAYAGVATLIFCLIALRRIDRKEVWPWAVGIAFVSLAAIRSPFAIVPYLAFLKSPLVHSRLAYLIPVMMAFLAPMGIRVFLEGSKRTRLATALIVGGLVLLVWALAKAPVAAPVGNHLQAAARTFAVVGASLSAILLACGLGWLSPRAFKTACLILLTCDLLFFAREHTMAGAFAPEAAWHPQNNLSRFLTGLPEADRSRYRFDMVMGTPWPGLPPFSPAQPNLYQPMLNLDYGLREVNGYASVIGRRYLELVIEGRPHPDPMRIPLAWYELLPPEIADLAAVKYYVLPDRPELTRGLAAYADRVFSADGAAVFRKRRAVSRFHLACRLKEAQTLSEVLSLVRDPAFDPVNEAIVEPDSGLMLGPRSCEGRRQLRLEISGPGLFVGTATLDHPGVLVVSEAFDQGWQAWINGRNVPVRQADYAFQGIALPAGHSRIELRFRPPHYGWVLACAACGLGALAGLGGFLLVGVLRRLA